MHVCLYNSCCISHFNIFLEMPESLQHIIKWMISPDINIRPEVSDLLKVPAVQAHAKRRQWKLRMASLLKKLTAISRLWHAFLTFLTSLMFFKTSKKVDTTETKHCRLTPEPYPIEKEVPNIMINDNSFSDGAYKILEKLNGYF